MPKEIEEAARLDGMGFLRIFLTVVVPLSWPGFVATGLIVFIFSWNEFPLALVLMTQNAMRTAPVGISLYPGEYAFPWETISTATVVAIVPILLVTAIFQKQIVGGLTAGIGK
jgi:multiple sugar transport system permease protein